MERQKKEGRRECDMFGPEEVKQRRRVRQRVGERDGGDGESPAMSSITVQWAAHVSTLHPSLGSSSHTDTYGEPPNGLLHSPFPHVPRLPACTANAPKLPYCMTKSVSTESEEKSSQTITIKSSFHKTQWQSLKRRDNVKCFSDQNLLRGISSTIDSLAEKSLLHKC